MKDARDYTNQTQPVRYVCLYCVLVSIISTARQIFRLKMLSPFLPWLWRNLESMW